MPTLAEPWLGAGANLGFFQKKSQGSQGWPANLGPTWGAKVGLPTLSQHWIKGKLGYCLEILSCFISMK